LVRLPVANPSLRGSGFLLDIRNTLLNASPENLAIPNGDSPITLPIIDYKLISSFAGKMRSSVIFLLITIVVASVDPVCQVIPPPSDKVYNAPNELQALDLSLYFRGYNLSYEISVDSPYLRLIPPFWNNNITELPNPVKDGTFASLG